ncbi:16S rRNA processing protein RimM [Phototrophicus methaneseepsis]|uniref:Ribosome maturation factor RimM n=1 Tax=Phototrophicus methaneseepsis TaxID=2710758 RepID=A0A7S8E5N9_9CHLR|nr:ribosome maturation factor RimM [Phototrophicus methaneseepsis]QPC80853.1 16S rRNA processing protein RimM [Phototrophicus methaneseepsis]
MPKRQNPKYLLLGKIERPHGIRGELRISLLTAYPERLKELEHVYLGADPNRPNATRYTIDTVRFHKGAALIKFEEAPTRNEAELLRGQMVMIDLAHAVPLEEDEVYLYQLIGLKVQTEDGAELGVLRDVLETGANDVYILDSPQYGELLIPAHEETLIDVDLEAETVTMRLPEGLLPD